MCNRDELLINTIESKYFKSSLMKILCSLPLDVLLGEHGAVSPPPQDVVQEPALAQHAARRQHHHQQEKHLQGAEYTHSSVFAPNSWTIKAVSGLGCSVSLCSGVSLVTVSMSRQHWSRIH